MDAISLPMTTSPLKQISKDYPQFVFLEDEISHWSPHENTIYHLSLTSSEALWELLHELAHALLNHKEYRSDTSLLKIEVSAWEYARYTLAPRYTTEINSSYIEETLATYREWLQRRSTCPTCGATGLQRGSNYYSCLGCAITWKTNDARQCAGRRFIVS